jgi:sirohydrochlorin cobaltochelatase
MDHRDAALVVAGHGSTLNEDSSAPTFQHADTLRRRGLFAEVHECFWKEEPHFRDVLRQIEAERVYVVPNFISEGYFTEQVVPRELGVTGRVSKIDGREVYYCDPVGIHPDMKGVLLHRAGEILGGEPVDLKETCLFIAGHGTSQNQNSTKIVYRQAELIGEMGIYGECRAFFMEQAPFVKDWAELTAKKNVIVVPFFISDGLHSYDDIPVLLGISANVKEEGFRNPTSLRGRRLWYARAIGTEPLIADVILAQVAAFDAHFRGIPAVASA